MIWVFIKTCDGGAEQSAIAREMLYTALSEKFALPMIEIKKTTEGKPYFDGVGYPAFSISHTDGAVCVAVSDTAESVGVDIEKCTERLRNKRITDRFFPHLTPHENEINDIEILTESESRIEPSVDSVFTLGEAIIVYANDCERCMNVLCYKYLNGAEGYPEYSEEWKKCNTVCEWCKDESFDK